MRLYTNERDVKKVVRKLLEKYQWFWWMPPANGYGKSGISDFNAIKNGVFLAIETKFKSNQVTPLQVSYLRAVLGEHCMAFVINENRIESLDAWFALFDKSVEAAMQNKELDKDELERMNQIVKDLTQELD